MAQIRIDKDSAYEWFVIPDIYDGLWLTLDLPQATVEWIKRVAAEWDLVQEVLEDAAEQYYAEQRARTV